MNSILNRTSKSWRTLGIFMGLLTLVSGVLTACKAKSIPTVPGTSALTVNVTYNGATTVVGKSELEVGLFSSDAFSQSSLVATAQAGALISTLPATGTATFNVPAGTYYLAALNNVNGSGTFFDHTDRAYPACGDPYTTYNAVSNFANGVNFSWPLSSGNKATAVNVSGNTSVAVTFGDTFISTGVNGQPNYGGTAVSITGTAPAGIYAIAFMNPSATTRTPANDWGYNPDNATNVTLSTIEDLPSGSTIYVLLFADSGNANNAADAGNCGGVTPCLQGGDPYTIVGPLTVGQNPKPSTGVLTVNFADTNIASGAPAATATYTRTPTATGTVTPTATITLSPTITLTPAQSFTFTETPTVTQTPTITPTPTQSPTVTNSFTPTSTFTVTATPTVTATMVTLSPGDVSIIAFLRNGNSQFAFVNTTAGNLPAGTVLYFTNDSWDGTQGAGSGALVDESATLPATLATDGDVIQEAIISYTVGASGLAPFTPVVVSSTSNAQNSLQGGALGAVSSAVTNLTLNKNGSGDKILAYQVPSAGTTVFLGGVIFGPDAWQTSGAVTNFYDSYLPTGLSASNSTDLSVLWNNSAALNGQAAVTSGMNQNAVLSSCVNSLSGIVDGSNWTGNAEAKGSFALTSKSSSTPVSLTFCGSGNVGFTPALAAPTEVPY
jgi:hypothetical protein